MPTPRLEEDFNEKAYLVGLRRSGVTPAAAQEHLDELQLLAVTAGAECVAQTIQTRRAPDPATFIGSGKTETIINQAQELDCDLIIFDDDLSPAQLKNIQTLAGEEVKIVDRSGLILHIFAQHARTRESKVQVDLARNQYLLPRLTGMWTHLERQKGGIGTRGGMGESQIEVDRRHIRNKISKLREQLRQIERERKTQSQRRSSAFRVALVGYTNAGKSTLMNALTGSDTLVQDQLFATLDTTTRQLHNPSEYPILLSDTVGFIRKLPHHLVASFRSTLAEAADADLLLKVLDVSSPAIHDHAQTINSVLEDLGIHSNSSLTVLNKIDCIEEPGRMQELARAFPDAVAISARDHLRLDTLLTAIEERYRADFFEATLKVPPEKGHLLYQIHNKLDVLEEDYVGDVAVLKVAGPQPTVRQIQALLGQAPDSDSA